MPTGRALSNFIKILSLFNTQPNRPRASPAIFKHVGQVPYSRGFKFGEKGPIKIFPIFAYRSGAVEFHQILSIFNTQTNRPRASPAIFKHVGQVSYSRGFKFGENGPIKIFLIFAYRSSAVEFHQILSLFNTQPNRPRASPAIFKHVGQVSYSRGFKFGEKGPIKIFPIFAYRSGAVEFHQILSLFNTQPNRPRASPAIFKHVGQVPYSRGFKFGEKVPIKILPHFCLQVRRCRISSKF